MTEITKENKHKKDVFLVCFNHKNVNLIELKHRSKSIKDAVSGRIFENRIELEWLSTKQAAKYLSVSENALRIMVCRDQVKSFKLGSRLRFRLSDLQVLLNLKEV